MNREPGSMNRESGSLNRESDSTNSSLVSTVLLDDGNDGQLVDSSGLVSGQTSLLPTGGQVSSGPYYGLISPTFASNDTGLVTTPSQVHFSPLSTVSASSNLISNNPSSSSHLYSTTGSSTHVYSTTGSSSAHVYYSIGEISESADRQSKPKNEEGKANDLFANIEII